MNHRKKTLNTIIDQVNFDPFLTYTGSTECSTQFGTTNLVMVECNELLGVIFFRKQTVTTT